MYRGTAVPTGNTHSTCQQLLDCPSGTFEYDVATDTFTWSDELFRMHGYERGDVVPTLRLGLAHVHPDDREPTRARWVELTGCGGRYTNYHTIIDADGTEHRVLSVVEAPVEGGSGPIRGVITDLTLAFEKESRAVANEAVAQSAQHRATIEQAKGVLMAHFTTNADTAFEILVRMSSVSNRRLNELVADFVATVTANGVRHAIHTYIPAAGKAEVPAPAKEQFAEAAAAS
jgi:ANTAR domain/PAS fold